MKPSEYEKKYGHLYPEGFFWWLAGNPHIWKDFEARALRMAKIAERTRYSARTIVEVMRWDSDIREKNPLFKISNNMVPGMARLWMHKYGDQHPKFFHLRGQANDSEKEGRSTEHNAHLGQRIQDRC